MTGELPTPLGRRVWQRMQAKGIKARTLSVQIGRDPTFIRDILEGRKLSVRGAALIDLATALATTPAWLETGAGPEEALPQDASGLSMVRARDVVIRGEVAAGVWSEAWDITERIDPADWEAVTVAPPPGYERATLFALRVRGRSMDRFYLEGDVLIVCPAAETDARVGDHVIVLRRRSGLAETTVKELIATPNGFALAAHSTDPAFSTPMPLDDDGDDTPDIIGVVVGSYRTRPRPPPVVPMRRKRRDE